MEIFVIDATMLTEMFRHGTLKLVANKTKVDSLNVFPVPDGDTGTNMSMTMSNAIESLERSQIKTVEDVAKIVAKGSLMGARGNSGVILSQIFRGFSQATKNLTEMSVADFVVAIEMASQTAYKAVLKPVEGTILTVIREISEDLQKQDIENMNFEELLRRVLEVGQQSLDNTPNILPALKQAGVIDSGGQGLMLVLEGFYEVVSGTAEQIDSKLMAEVSNASMSAEEQIAQAHINTKDIKYGYCTEFIVRGQDMMNKPLKEEIIDMGDSMVYVPDEDMIKIHIHTNDPGFVMQKALQYGDLIKIKIENMRLQHSTILENHGVTGANVVEAQTNKKIGVVAVASGDGIEHILKDLGVDLVISGGQTMNPSTADIEKAIKSVAAESVIIFPNNSNIILAAKQAAELSEKPVVVLETKTVLQAVTAMIAFRQEVDLETNVVEMQEALEDVTTIQITYAVRDTEFEGVKIVKDDFLAIVDGKIKVSDKDIKKSVKEALAVAIDDDSEIISIYYGQDITATEAEALKAELEAEMPEMEIELQAGGQPVYHYLIGIE